MKVPWNKGLKTGGAHLKGKHGQTNNALELYYKTHTVWNKGLKGVTAGDKSNNWKGDKVGYHGLHKWIQSTLGKPQSCVHCGTLDAKRYEWANKSREYKREVTDWLRLCTRCHHIYDGRAAKAWATRRKTYVETI